MVKHLPNDRVLSVLSRWHALQEVMRGAPRPVLVFRRIRDGTEAAARLMRQRFPGQPICFYHAGLGRDERARIETWFLGSSDGVLCATSAYRLGVDKPDIRTVVHADVPPSVEAYLQETGRAGRDGKPSGALLLRSREDIAFAGRLTEETSFRRYGLILGNALQQGQCRRRTLLSLIGQEPVHCSGCDVCEGSAVDGPAGEADIVRFVRLHPRRFTPAQAAAILTGEPGPEAVRGFHDTLAGWNALAGWERDDAEEAIRWLVADVPLRVAPTGPWAGRLTTGLLPSSIPVARDDANTGETGQVARRPGHRPGRSVCEDVDASGVPALVIIQVCSHSGPAARDAYCTSKLISG